MSYELLVINPNYPKALTDHCRSLVGFVVDNDNKIVNQSFIKREALPDWFAQKRAIFNPVKHRFIVGAISITGELIDSQEFKPKAGENSPISH